MQRSFVRRGYALAEVISAVRQVVMDLHTGKIPAFSLPGQRAHLRRYVPSFIQGYKPAGTMESKAYTAKAVSEVLRLTKNGGRGSVKASLAVEAALHLLELREMGKLSDEDLQRVTSGDFELQEILRLFPKEEVREARADAAAAALLQSAQIP
jgi:hypothetical protein